MMVEEQIRSLRGDLDDSTARAGGWRYEMKRSLNIMMAVSVLAVLLVLPTAHGVQGQEPVDSSADWVQYTDPYWGFSISYPADWNLQNLPFKDFGFRISHPDLSVDPLGRPTRGAFLAVSVRGTTEKEWTTHKSGYHSETKLAGAPAFQSAGIDDDGYPFVEWVVFAYQHLHRFRYVSASREIREKQLPIVQRILNSLALTGEYSDHPTPDYSKLLDSFSFSPIKHAFEVGPGKIIGGYEGEKHTGGDDYALDICPDSGCAYNGLVLAPTDITLVWPDDETKDFHIFEISEDDNGNKLCMSLGHFYIKLPGFTVGKRVPRGAEIGRLSNYSPPHIHMGIWHSPQGSICAGGSRTAIPFKNVTEYPNVTDSPIGDYRLDCISYPEGQNHRSKRVESTNWGICIAPSGLYHSPASLSELSDCVPELPPPPSNDDATFVSDITIPDGTVLSPGQSFTKIWRLRNSGTSTWGSGYELVFVGGNQMGAPSSVGLPHSVATGEEVDISVNMTAPSTGGNYQGDWKMRNAQGVYFGDLVWVKITVPGGPEPTPPPDGGTGDIEIKSVEYPSVVSPGQTFRPRVTVRVNQGQLLESRGDMLRNTDGNLYGAWPHVAVVGTVNAGQTYTFEFYENDPITAPSAEGTYESKWRVWRDGNWAGAEITIRFDVRSGGGTRPDPPTLVSPSNWYVSRDGSTPTLCASAPAGLQYYFDIYESHDIPKSGWISSNCWTPPGLGWYGYQWRVKVKDPGTGLESDWSDTWHFGIDTQEISLDDFTFIPPSPSAADEVRVRTCVQGFGGIGNSLKIWANTATDCSANGSWYWIDPKGNFCYDPAKPEEWPEFHTRPLADGCHLIRAIGYHGDLQAVKETTYTLFRRRPSNVQLINPGQDAWFNTRTITFRWNPEESSRVNYFTFHVSTNSDPIVNPIVTQTFDASTREYTYIFDQDYASLYWRLQACNEIGCGDAALGHFGIDQAVPSSAVNPLSATSFETVFTVAWQGGTDNASGIRWYDVQYREGDRGGWTDWQTNVTSQVAVFTGQAGHKYYFRARALDWAGNLEEYPAGDGDTFTQVDPAAKPPTLWWDTAYAHKRNILILNNDSRTLPVGYPVHLHLDSSTVPTAEEIYNTSLSGNKGDDMRVVYDNTTELNRYIQTFSASQIDIWFNTQVRSFPIRG